MNKLKNVLSEKNIGCGYLYFYIHFITEVVCFYYLTKVTGNNNFVWLIPFIYDGVAFVPQSLLGYLNDKYKKLNLSIIGTIILVFAFIIYSFTNLSIFISLIILCLGNACIHVRGAEITLNNSYGKLSHSAIFVAGGSFGVITGKLLSSINLNIIMILLILTMIPFILLAETYNSEHSNCKEFNYINKKINYGIIIILAVLVVIVRGYMGYGIPTSWNKTILQSILLYFTMGLGKALGGILSDAYGIKKIAVLSTILAIPFLLFGDNLMIVSLIGVMLFSMTMSITLGILVSTLKNNPGLSFGLTTIGLFLGTAPIFFIKITNEIFNLSLIVILSLLCTLILSVILRGDKYD